MIIESNRLKKLKKSLNTPSLKKQSLEYLLRVLKETGHNPIMAIVEIAADPLVPLEYRFKANQLLYRSLIGMKASVAIEHSIEDDDKVILKETMRQLEAHHEKDY